MIYKKNFDIKKNKSYICLDVGTKSIGVAICNNSLLIPSPKKNITRTSLQNDFLVINKLLMEFGSEIIVIGNPLQFDGKDSKMSKFIFKFADLLNEHINDNIIITFFDERFSSIFADDMLVEEFQISGNKRRKKNIDKISASIILQNFLNFYIK